MNMITEQINIDLENIYSSIQQTNLTIVTLCVEKIILVI